MTILSRLQAAPFPRPQSQTDSLHVPEKQVDMAKRMLTARLSTEDGVRMTASDLVGIDIFRDIDRKVIEKFPGTVVRREFAAGEVICREGEGGTTAFYLLEGSVQVFIARRLGARVARQSGGWRAMIGRWVGQKSISRPTHADDAIIPIDANVDLTWGQPRTTLGAGEVFGEMSCLNLAPRSATVVAETDCVMLEILRNMYEQLQKATTFRERMDANYRARALQGHLRNVPIFRDLPDEAMERLQNLAQLVAVDAGTTIFREGDEADGVYVIRLGQVRVSQAFPGGERTLAYLTRGDFFGETGLLRRAPRNATCQAVDHPIIEGGRKRKPARVELVKISKDDFAAMLEEFPRLKGRLETVAQVRIRKQQKARVSLTVSAPSQRVEDLGLLQGQNLMLIDLERCTRCDQCVDACVSAHDDGISRLFRTGPRYDKYLVPSSCRMCLDPVCMIGCPVGSIRRTEDLSIIIEDWCVGCGICAKQCPYESIVMHELKEFGEEVSERLARVAETGEVMAVTERAAVCDQCEDLPAGPACVYACPHDAAVRVNAAEFLSAAGLFKSATREDV